MTYDTRALALEMALRSQITGEGTEALMARARTFAAWLEKGDAGAEEKER